ncbi:hypothetical protein SPHINGOT1_110042 [Sphingomonas sp. T1]|nr:hypothetical protein SPHINGOT1_110042 [Sphingomonas sp. T1]
MGMEREGLAFVILTKVRIQGSGRRASWLWVLTFVRMTGEGWRYRVADEVRAGGRPASLRERP